MKRERRNNIFQIHVLKLTQKYVKFFLVSYSTSKKKIMSDYGLFLTWFQAWSFIISERFYPVEFARFNLFVCMSVHPYACVPTCMCLISSWWDLREQEKEGPKDGQLQVRSSSKGLKQIKSLLLKARIDNEVGYWLLWSQLDYCLKKYVV